MRLEAFAYCEKLVREHDRDRYLASLFAPAERRPFLFVLYAFALEIARVKNLVHEPVAGMIRLQWWHEAISGLRSEEAAANPVAAALVETIGIAGLSAAPLLRGVEARQAELHGEPAAGADAAIFVAAAELLGARERDVAGVAESAGRAMSFVREPADPDGARAAYLDFGAHIDAAPKNALPAFLPVALVPLLLLQPRAAQWRKQVALLRAAWFGFPNLKR